MVLLLVWLMSINIKKNLISFCYQIKIKIKSEINISRENINKNKKFVQSFLFCISNFRALINKCIVIIIRFDRSIYITHIYIHQWILKALRIMNFCKFLFIHVLLFFLLFNRKTKKTKIIEMIKYILYSTV